MFCNLVDKIYPAAVVFTFIYRRLYSLFFVIKLFNHHRHILVNKAPQYIFYFSLFHFVPFSLIDCSNSLATLLTSLFHKAGMYATGVILWHTLFQSLCVSWSVSHWHNYHIDYTTQHKQSQVESFEIHAIA
ncbi:hypothetical protein LCGC14_3080580 [marine sediment metagenome]|uniref:Uncharacterized protein n=1 Tax=marine sediment metagenome TaxID=412755 RepID=A0A0F8X1X7_9ZZZZ